MELRFTERQPFEGADVDDNARRHLLAARGTRDNKHKVHLISPPMQQTEYRTKQSKLSRILGGEARGRAAIQSGLWRVRWRGPATSSSNIVGQPKQQSTGYEWTENQIVSES
jgi:hypothetical protein